MAATDAVLAVIRASRPEFRSAHDRAAFAIHASFLTRGFSLGAVGSAAMSSSGRPADGREAGIDGWNQLENAYAFKYFSDDKDMVKSVDVNCTAISEMLMVDVAIEGGADLLHAEIRVPDYVKDDGAGNYGQQYKDLDGLVKTTNAQLVSKCTTKPPEPALSTRETGKTKVDEECASAPSRPYPSRPGVSAFRKPMGFNDLLPGPGAGVFEGKDNVFESGEAGNLVGPRHPLWNPQIFQAPGGSLRPPGARHDPFGPPGVPGFDPQRFGRGGGRGDLQHFPNDL